MMYGVVDICYVPVGVYACLNFLDKMTVGTQAGNVNTFSFIGQQL